MSGRPAAPRPAGAGLLVIRAWQEGPGAEGFRARITRTRDVLAEPPLMSVVTSAQELERLVAEWLAAVTRPAR